MGSEMCIRDSDVTIAPKSILLSDMVSLDAFALLAPAADVGELMTGKDQWRGIAKMILEQDRIKGLREKGYENVMLVKMRPESCTPKNDVLVAWPEDGSDSKTKSDEFTWGIDHQGNGVIYDFQNASILNGLGIREVETIDRMLRDTCLLYTSPSPRDLSTSRMPSSA